MSDNDTQPEREALAVVFGCERFSIKNLDLFATKSSFSINCNETEKKMLCIKFPLGICTKWSIFVIHYICSFDTIEV